MLEKCVKTARFVERMIFRACNSGSLGVITVSKGNKAVCMRLPPALLERMEAEAAAQGVTVPEICRRIIVEGGSSVGSERGIEQVTPTPTPSTSLYSSGNPRIEIPAQNPVGLSQKAEATIVAAAEAMQLAKLRAEFPELSPPTEAMIIARKGIAKLAKEHPEAVGMFLANERAKGKMSDREIAEFLEHLGV